jgi:hypothetical protein
MTPRYHALLKKAWSLTTGARSTQMLWYSPLGGYILSFIFPMLTVMDSWFTTHIRSLGESRDPMSKILGPEAGARLKPIWGLDAEGEIQGAWRDIGLPRLWCMIGEPFFLEGKKNNNAQRNVGNFALCRFHSTHIALRTFLSDELIRTHLFRIPADNMTFFLYRN